jgi:predicted dinucleotide-binding enzyme
MSDFHNTPADLGVLGTGAMGARLAAMFARAGRRVVLGSRDAARAAQVVAALDVPGLVPGTYAQAAAAKAVLPAVFLRDGLEQVLEALGPALVDKLLIDISNPFNADYSDYTLPWDDSSAELLQRRFPRTRVVGAFKHVYAQVFDAPMFNGVASDVLIVGDDEDKREFLALAQGTPFRYLDAGPLAFARAVERLTLVTGRAGRQLGVHPRMNWRLLGEAA